MFLKLVEEHRNTCLKYSWKNLAIFSKKYQSLITIKYGKEVLKYVIYRYTVAGVLLIKVDVGWI